MRMVAGQRRITSSTVISKPICDLSPVMAVKIEGKAHFSLCWSNLAQI
jgi:hypothetical protein